MHDNTTNSTRLIQPDDLELLKWVPCVDAFAVDESLNIFWHTQSETHTDEQPEAHEDYIGQAINEIELDQLHHDVMRSGRSVCCYGLGPNATHMVSVFPLNIKSFGHAGTLIVMNPIDCDQFHNSFEIPHRTDSYYLYELRTLTASELDLLHRTARGQSLNLIADQLGCSRMTIEQRIEAIHTKLNTTSIADLVEFASRHGILAYSATEWATIVKSSQIYRREHLHANQLRLA